jgi:hypothetical protein
MLVYARTPPPGSERLSGPTSASNNLTVPVPFPPPHALKVVHAISSAHNEACKTYTETYDFHLISLAALFSNAL